MRRRARRVRSVQGAGATVVQEPYGMEEAPDQGLIATFADPDDNYFQRMSPMSREPTS